MRRVLIGLLAGAIVMTGVAYAAMVRVELSAGDQLAISCTADVLQITQDNPVSALAICSANATATPVPADTATPIPADTATPEPTPTPTMDHSGHGGDTVDMHWHAPGVFGNHTAHEHGDAPPAWLTAAGINPAYTHAGNTPNENSLSHKHTAFKGWAGNFNGQDWYGVFHLDFNPGGHVSRFHSYQLWIKADNGDISTFTGWLDFGVGNNTGPNLVVTCGADSPIRPIILVNQSGCQPRFENWYAAPASGGRGNWSPDIGFNIAPTYFNGGDAADPSTWQSIYGYPNNLNRRIEFAWYANRSNLRGEFYATQFGDVVSGPADPVCGTQRSYGDRAYTVLCLRQYISPALRSIQFPGNAVQREFPGGDVVELPN